MPPKATVESCKAALIAGYAYSGIYEVELPSSLLAGGHSPTAVDAYCDQSIDGGGWMLLLTQADPQNDMSGTHNPFTQTVNQDQPSTDTLYARDWTESGYGLAPSATRADQFMVMRHSTGEYAIMTISKWMEGLRWARTASHGNGMPETWKGALPSAVRVAL